MNLDREFVKFMIWYKNHVPIGTQKTARQIVDDYLDYIEKITQND